MSNRESGRRYSEPPGNRGKDMDGDIKKATLYDLMQLERIREDMGVLRREDRETYEGLVWGDE